MRALIPLLFAFGALAGGAFAAHAVETHTYVGTTTRDPLVGPVVVCDATGSGIGGACFTDLPERGFATVVVRDANLPSWARVPLIIYAYDSSGFPVDGQVECPVNHGAVLFRFDEDAVRIVVGVGHSVKVGTVCAGAVGTTGTISVSAYI